MDAPTSADPLKDEYRKLLSSQTIRELRGLARKRNIPIEGTRKAPIVEQLVTQLCDRQSIATEVLNLDDLGRKLLVYLHLTLPHSYGIPIEGIKLHEWQTGPAHVVRNTQHATRNDSPDAIRARAVEMSKRGLLLTFKQRKGVYYLLPSAVRLCIPPQPNLVPAYAEEKIASLEVREQSFASLSQKLYAVWSYIAEQHPKRRATPSRTAIEDEWPQLHGWNHLPSEIDELGHKRGQFYPSAFAYTGNQAMTVPAPTYHLRDPDRGQLRTQLDYGQHAHGDRGHADHSRLDEEIEFYYTLLTEISAIVGEPGEALQADSQALQRLLSLSPPEQVSILAKAWRVTTAYSEMDTVLRASDDIRLRRNVVYTTCKPQALYEEWREGRATISRFLSLLEENRWIPIDGLLQTIFKTTPNLIHAHSRPEVWWLESVKSRKQFGTHFDDWGQSAGHFVRAVIEGPLTWLGMVRLGYQGDHGCTHPTRPEAIQLTPTGSFLTGRRQTLAESAVDVAGQRSPQPGGLPNRPEKAIELHDDLTATLAPGRAPPQLYELLYTIGQLITSSPQQLTYRITASGVQRAFDKGETAETLIASLERTCGEQFRGVGVPATWRKTIEEWYQNYGKLCLYEGITLVELADEYALQELMLNTSLCEKIVYQFSPQLIAIQPDAVAELVQEMEKQGYTPRVE